jgi:hypothetical protein
MVPHQSMVFLALPVGHGANADGAVLYCLCQGRQNVAPSAHTMGLPSVFADVPELRFDFPLEETLEAPDHSIAVRSAESELSEFLEAPPWSPKSGHPSWFTLFGELRWDGL